MVNNRGQKRIMGGTKQTLSPKHKRFIAEYMIDQNGTQAAIRAGYSKRTAVVQASRLLTKANIAREIEKRRANISNKLEVTQERVIAEYARIAFFDPRKLYDENGNLKPVTDLDEDTAAVLQSIDQNTLRTRTNSDGEVETEGIDKLRLHSKINALDSLSRHLGLFERDNQQREIVVNVVNQYDETPANKAENEK